jgi:hypothetical protein
MGLLYNYPLRKKNIKNLKSLRLNSINLILVDRFIKFNYIKREIRFYKKLKYYLNLNKIQKLYYDLY